MVAWKVDSRAKMMDGLTAARLDRERVLLSAGE